MSPEKSGKSKKPDGFFSSFALPAAGFRKSENSFDLLPAHPVIGEDQEVEERSRVLLLFHPAFGGVQEITTYINDIIQ